MTEIILGSNEHFESALRKFKKKTEKEGIMKEVKKRTFYEKPCEKRKRKQAAADKRVKKRLQRARQKNART